MCKIWTVINWSTYYIRRLQIYQAALQPRSYMSSYSWLGRRRKWMELVMFIWIDLNTACCSWDKLDGYQVIHTLLVPSLSIFFCFLISSFFAPVKNFSFLLFFSSSSSPPFFFLPPSSRDKWFFLAPSLCCITCLSLLLSFLSSFFLSSLSLFLSPDPFVYCPVWSL